MGSSPNKKTSSSFSDSLADLGLEEKESPSSSSNVFEEETDASGPSSRNPSSTLRAYQQEILDEIQETHNNHIVVLPTGTGKTIIAHRVAHMAKQKHPKKCVVFLAPMVPLCTQQEERFKQYSEEQKDILKTKLYCGGKREDNYASSCAINDIFFMTPQVLADDLKAKKIKFDWLSLIIFDECHHAVGNDPYAVILNLYRKYESSLRPRIIGLSASPASGKDFLKVYSSMLEICRKFHASILNASSENMKGHVFCPEMELLALPNFQESSFPFKLKALIEQTWPNLNPATIGELEVADDDDVHDFMVLVEIFERVTILGIEELLRDPKACDIVENYLPLPEGSKEGGALDTMLSIINETRKGTEDSGTPFLTILFVNMRSTAAMLTTCFNNAASSRKDCSWIKAKFFVGHNNKKSAVRMTQAMQKEVVEEFRKGDINVLVATSIAEEGIDVPNCKLVLRLQTFQLTTLAMIQSRGRARYPESRYVILAPPALLGDIEATADHERVMNFVIKKMKGEVAFEEANSWENKAVPSELMGSGLGKALKAFKTTQKNMASSTDYKAVLNNFTQNQRLDPPSYDAFKVGGQPHTPIYTGSVFIVDASGEKITASLPETEHRPSKKEAEQAAAKALLEKLENMGSH